MSAFTLHFPPYSAIFRAHVNCACCAPHRWHCHRHPFKPNLIQLCRNVREPSNQQKRHPAWTLSDFFMSITSRTVWGNPFSASCSTSCAPCSTSHARARRMYISCCFCRLLQSSTSVASAMSIIRYIMIINDAMITSRESLWTNKMRLRVPQYLRFPTLVFRRVQHHQLDQNPVVYHSTRASSRRGPQRSHKHNHNTIIIITTNSWQHFNVAPVARTSREGQHLITKRISPRLPLSWSESL